MTLKVWIRPAKPADAVVLAGLSGELGYPSPTEVIQTRLKQLLESRNDAVLAAETPEGMVCGWVHIFLAHRLESDSFAEMGGLVVAEGVRGQGVGRALVAEAERWASRQGMPFMRVRSNVAREDAHAFYRRLGYESLKTQGVFTKNLSAAG